MIEQGADQVVLVVRVVADQAWHLSRRFREKQVRRKIHAISQWDQDVALDRYFEQIAVVHFSISSSCRLKISRPKRPARRIAEPGYGVFETTKESPGSLSRLARAP